MSELTDQHVATIKDAASKQTGADRRAFQAQVTLDYLGGVLVERNGCSVGLRARPATSGCFLPARCPASRLRSLIVESPLCWIGFVLRE
jgi:hypothetical protein